MTQTLQRVAIDDIALSYCESGSGDGTPVVFVPGYTDSCYSYGPLLAEFPGRFRLIAVSQRGHGDSDKPRDGYTLDQLAADLLAFLDALGVGRAVLVGHSLGTLVALRVASDHPERVLGLCLLGAMKTLRGNPGAQELWSEAVQHIGAAADPAFVREFQQGTLAQPVDPAWFERIVSESCKLPGFVWRDLLSDALHDQRDIDFGSIPAPALVVWGDQDGFTGLDEQDAMSAAMPRGALRVVAGAGHAVHWEQPRETAAMLEAFFETVVPARIAVE